ncbi:MAG: polyphosphate polymerase domain-containing protein [Bacteroidota bacterium]|nr:polyphosphate polymerase domain-containing protein [Bacteroidota bacterium]
MPVSEDQERNLRYERKFLVSSHSYKDLEHLLKFHPACFSPVYHERRVNNIYFDSPGFTNYYDNIDGEKDRLKIRIRWYGDTFGTVASPVMEMKIKKGLLGNKRSYSLNPFIINNDFDRNDLEEILSTGQIPDHTVKHVLSLFPVLLNTYVRRYFISADKNFRITIDRDMNFYAMHYGYNTFLNHFMDARSTVLELKYNNEFEDLAKELASALPFPLTKSSKYVSGLEHTLK